MNIRTNWSSEWVSGISRVLWTGLYGFLVFQATASDITDLVDPIPSIELGNLSVLIFFYFKLEKGKRTSK